MNTIFSYDIKHVTSETDLDRALSFARAIFKDSGRLNIPTFSKEFWLARMPDYADFMLYAQHHDEIVGVVFGYVESNNSITVAPVASDERYHHCGIASSLIKELEKRVLARGHHFIVIGALEAAEGFYLKCGYTPHLFIQSRPPLTLENLRLLNDRYDEAWSYDDGTDIRLCIQTKGIDRELQHKYDEAFPDCSTQTLFTKYI
jgi:GNAT superfamily N-acetyltransferase